MLTTHPPEGLASPIKKRCGGNNIKQHSMVRFQFWRSGGVWNTPSLSLLPGPQ